MEDEEQAPAMLPPVAPSLESRSRHQKMPSSASNRGGRGRGGGSTAAKSTAPTPSASISVDTDMVCIFVDDLICRMQPRMCVIRVNICRMPLCQFFMFIHVSM